VFDFNYKNESCPTDIFSNKTQSPFFTETTNKFPLSLYDIMMENGLQKVEA